MSGQLLKRGDDGETPPVWTSCHFANLPVWLHFLSVGRSFEQHKVHALAALFCSRTPRKPDFSSLGTSFHSSALSFGHRVFAMNRRGPTWPLQVQSEAAPEDLGLN